MKLTLGSNILTMQIARSMNEASSSMSTAFERLSTGQRINSASDDSAGLAIAKSLESDSRLYNQARRNINDGLSLLSVAEGAITQLNEIVSRISELAEQAANGTYSSQQRQALDAEAQALVQEFSRIAESTTFNDQQVFSDSGTEFRLQTGIDSTGSTLINLGPLVQSLRPDGTFSNPYAIPAARATFDFGLGDFDNDGHVDMAYASSNSADGLRVSLGDGAGNLTYLGSMPITSGIYYIGTGDFDDDGNLDLAMGSRADDDVLLALGNGDGTFNAPVAYGTALAGDLQEIRVGDMNNDGYEDIVASGGGLIEIFTGRADGTLNAGVTYTATASNGKIELADLNSDGNLDVVNIGNGTSNVEVFLGAGDGSIATSDSFTTHSTYDRGLFLEDVNSDGVIDIVTGRGSSSAVDTYVYFGNNDGTFQAEVRSNLPAELRNFTDIADVNGDGILDLLDRADERAVLYLGQGDGTFAVSDSYTLHGGTKGGPGRFTDLNEDGVLDIVAMKFDGTGPTAVALLGNASYGDSSLSVDLLTQETAQQALDHLVEVQEGLMSELGSVGSQMSRLTFMAEHAEMMGAATHEAYARIMDVDVAYEVANLVTTRIRQESASALFAQANLSAPLVLELLK